MRETLTFQSNREEEGVCVWGGPKRKNEQVNKAMRASGETEEERQRCAVVWPDSITTTA